MTSAACVLLPRSHPGSRCDSLTSPKPEELPARLRCAVDLPGNTTEGNHAGLMFFSDHGTPQGWRFNHGYGCHTFKWVNKEGKFVYIKYHFIANHGQKQFTEPEASRISGEDPDYSKRDLWETIERGEEVKWTAYIQVMQPDDADPENLGFDPFDVTKT